MPRPVFLSGEHPDVDLSIDFIRCFPHLMATKTHQAPIDWVEGGYLFVVPPEHVGLLVANHAIQRQNGCEADLLDRAALMTRFPSMRVDDLGAGVHTPRDGWCDPYQMLHGLRRKVTDLGGRVIADEVVALDVSGKAVRFATLRSGARIAASSFVNVAGAWSAQVGAMAGMSLPIAPLRRFEHYFTCGNRIERLPYVKDVHRLAFRSEAVDSPAASSIPTRRADTTSTSITTISSARCGPRSPIASRHSKRPSVTARGRACTSSANWTAIPSSATGPVRSRIFTSAQAFQDTG
jgi:hypothetical protein